MLMGPSFKAITRRSPLTRSISSIVASDVTAQPADSCHLVPMVAAIRQTMHRRPRRLSADAGYYSEANVTAKAVRGIDLFVAVRKHRHHAAPEPVTRGRIPQSCLHQGADAAQVAHQARPPNLQPPESDR